MGILSCIICALKAITFILKEGERGRFDTPQGEGNMKMETGDGMERQSKTAFEMNMSVR